MGDPVELFAEVLKDFNDHYKWNNAILAKIKTISNQKVGSVGQLFIERLCDKLSISWKPPVSAKGKRVTQNPWDIQIENIRFELKTATEDTNEKFQFNHVRYHREYEALLCLGVSPDKLYFGVWSKADVVTGKTGRLVSMEKGANASYKLTKAPNQLFDIALFKEKITEFAKGFKG